MQASIGMCVRIHAITLCSQVHTANHIMHTHTHTQLHTNTYVYVQACAYVMCMHAMHTCMKNST